MIDYISTYFVEGAGWNIKIRIFKLIFSSRVRREAPHKILNITTSVGSATWKNTLEWLLDTKNQIFQIVDFWHDHTVGSSSFIQRVQDKFNLRLFFGQAKNWKEYNNCILYCELLQSLAE